MIQKVLSLHTENNTVWTADNTTAPTSTGLAPAEFLQRELVGIEKVRMLGFAKNAQLICGLYGKCVVEVATPTVCDAQDLSVPEAVIYRMQQCMLPASIGGWHPVTDIDLATYKLFMQTTEADLVLMFKLHPLYKRLSFIESLRSGDAARVLMTIVDPRWFVRPSSPTSITAVYDYLGVTPGIAKKWQALKDAQTITANASLRRKIARFDLVNKAMYGELADCIPEPSSRNFLFYKHMSAKSEAISSCRRARSFVTFLVRNWYATIAGPAAEEHFIPSMYFSNAADAGEFRKFVYGSVT